jgi:hypothetical protein
VGGASLEIGDDLLGACVADPRDCLPAPPGCIAWWSGDGNANDIQGTNHGTLQGGATFATGRVSGAFLLDGVNDYVITPASALLDFGPSSEFTMMVWFNTETNDVFQMVLEKSSPGLPRDWGVYVSPENRIFSAIDKMSSTTVVTQGLWYHAAVTYSNAVWTMFVNGLPEAQVSDVPITRASNPLLIGHKASFFKGLIDEVQIFNQALGATEVASIYSAAGAGLCKAPVFLDIASDPGSLTLLKLKGQTGKDVEVQTSANLTGWTTLLTFPNPDGFLQCIDPSTVPPPVRFYRAKQE